EQLERLRDRLVLNQPAPTRDLRWVGGVVRLDLGRPIRSNRPVVSEISARMGPTFELALIATAVAVIIGIPVGVISATRPNSIADHFFTLTSFLGLAMPVFWQALVMILLFSFTLKWFPASVRGDGLQYY